MSYRFKLTTRLINSQAAIKEELLNSLQDAYINAMHVFKCNPDACCFEERKNEDGRKSFTVKDRGNKIIYQLKQL